MKKLKKEQEADELGIQFWRVFTKFADELEDDEDEEIENDLDNQEDEN